MSLQTTKEQFYSSHPFQDEGSDRLEKVKDIVSNLPQGKTLLDIGCGTGSFTSQLKEYAAELYGIEITRDAAAEAKKRGITTYQLDLDEKDLPFGKNFFDIVVCGEFIEHLVDPDHLLDEIYRTLKPKGVAIITTPNLASYLNRIVLLFGFQPYLTGTGLRYNTGKFFGEQEPCPHLIVFTHRALKELLLLHGFTIIKSVGAISTHRMSQPFHLVDVLLSNIPSFASNLIFVIEKR